MIKKILGEIRQGNVSCFYTSKTWKKKRKEILSRDNNECQLCKREGKDTTNQVVRIKGGRHANYRTDKQTIRSRRKFSCVL